MGNKVVIYDTGQTYEIDSDLIYTPWFMSVMSALDNKTMYDVGLLKKLEIEVDTVSEKENIHEPN